MSLWLEIQVNPFKKKFHFIIFSLKRFKLQIKKELLLGIELSKRQGVRNTLVMLDKDILVVRENNSTVLSLSTFLLKESDVDVVESLKKPKQKGQRRAVSRKNADCDVTPWSAEN